MSQVAGHERERTGLSDERLRELFREMLLIRRFEEKVEERFRAGELPGFLHVAIGEEATAVGVCAALERDDVIASTHRAHGHAIAKGTAIERVMAELSGKVEGCSHGHICDCRVIEIKDVRIASDTRTPASPVLREV